MAAEGDVLSLTLEGSRGYPMMGITSAAIAKFLRTNTNGQLQVELAGGSSTIGTVNQGTPLASGSGWRNTEYGPTGLPNAYFNIAGIFEIPTCIVGDPNTGTPWSFITGGGLGLGLVNLRNSVGTECGITGNPWVTNIHQWGGTNTTLGQKAMTASVPVVIASNQGNLNVNLFDSNSAKVNLGQQVMIDSLPVVIASNQTAVSVDTELAAAAALADNFSNPTTSAIASMGMLFDGTTWDRWRGDSAAGAWVQGPAANDSAALGNPVQIGGVFRSTPNVVEDGDIGSLSLDDEQNLHQSVRRKSQVLTDINITYDDSPTSATSAAMDVRKFRQGLFYAELTEAGTATDITFTLQMSHDNSNWYDYRVGPWVRYTIDDATISSYGTMLICEPFFICGSYIRMVVTATGTTATDTFTVADAYFEVLD